MSKVWYQVVDTRSEHPFTVQQALPAYLGVRTPEYQTLPLLAARSEADDVVKRCNKVVGGEFFAHRRVVLQDAL